MIHTTRRYRVTPSAGAGLTLVELLVALALGLLVVAGAVQAYVRGSSDFRLAEIMTRLEENARLTLATIEPDARLAGYWGQHNAAGLLQIPGSITVRCGADDVTGFALDLASGIDVQDDDYALPCPAYGAARAGSDVLVVRHAGSEAVAPEAGQIQLQSSLAGATLFDDGEVPAGFDATSSTTHDLQVDAYYIDEQSGFAPGTPSLRRLTLVRGGTLQNQEIIAGVENLQVQLGLDTNGDGAVDRHVDAPGAAGHAPGTRVVALRIWLLVRADAAPGAGFTDTRQHAPPDADLAPITPGDAGYPAQYPRVAITRTLFLANLASARDSA